MSQPVTYDLIRSNEEVLSYINAGDHVLEVMGYTEHGVIHTSIVASWSSEILEAFGYDEKDIELVKIASFLHDIGNVVNRVNHAHSGAIMAFEILTRLSMHPSDIAKIISAIGNHDEGSGLPISPIAAALMIADKSDVRRSRVRNENLIEFDIHDRVNYAVEKAELKVNASEKSITLDLSIDTSIAPKIEYFEIFLSRMIMCRKAAHTLGASFILMMNGSRML
jgi:metal-dependent HD superfamily phosphatase/phosphodiesterase